MFACAREGSAACEVLCINAAELLPRAPHVLALQAQLVATYQLATETVGGAASARLRILPFGGRAGGGPGLGGGSK